ncbi:hypothetical protein D5S19_13330 [Amycolatopsis panacis]|uniref:Uncharacterized protein n=1 Tax=Amycolatopsis panacis TaxID=2340917 RepID=A0A419I5A4_9PSEU|nr:hypothetical protein D5S19_13330 [Amycolatopsis panacis]
MTFDRAVKAGSNGHRYSSPRTCVESGLYHFNQHKSAGRGGAGASDPLGRDPAGVPGWRGYAFAPELPVSADASALERLLALVGRPADWAPKS